MAELKKLRVVIADDNEEMLHALVRVLRNDFDIVALAENGRGLIDQAISSHPDIIVSDISMPLLTGPKAQKELITRGFHTPFVFISGETQLLGGQWSLVDKLDISGELKAAILSTAAGQVYISRGASRKKSLRC